MSLLRTARRALLTALILSLILTSMNTSSAQTDLGAPRVLASMPAQREIAPPTSLVQLVFDQPMDRTSVETAFLIDPPVDGALRWTDDQTLVFVPAAPLPRGTAYLVQLDTTARSAQGLPLETRFRLNFQVAPNLSVNQVIPAPNAESIATNATITVIFDRPVVPLAVTGAQADLPQPLSFTPPLEGSGEWIGTAIYQFTPKNGLAGGTLYTATISADLSDVDGSTLSAPYTWQFRTIAPQILSVSPEGDQVRLESEVAVRFNQAMDENSLREAFTLRNTANGADVVGVLTLEMDGTLLRFKPASPLALETLYQASISAAARSANGEAILSNPQTFTFRTLPLPRVVSTNPTDGARDVPLYRGVSIVYSTLMDQQSFAERVSVEPKPDELSLSVSGNTLYLNFPPLPETDYTITVAAGVADIYGNTVSQPFVLRFRTAPTDPQLSLPFRDWISLTSAYRPQTGFPAVTLNLSALELQLGKLTSDELIVLSSDTYYPNLRNYRPSRLLRQWTQPIEAVRNRFVRTDIQLVEDGGKLPAGLYYIELFAPEFRRLLIPQEPRRHVLAVVTANLTVKQTPKALYVWAHDLATGAPLVDQPISLYHLGRRVAAARTDAQGNTRFDLPSAPDSYQGYWLILEGEGVFGIAQTNWRDSSFEPYAFDAPLDLQPVKTVTYLYTDQPIYRPGRPVYLRGIVRFQDDVTFAVPQNRPIQLTIFDPSGREVYSQALMLNEYGAFSAQYDLPQDAMLGGYSVRTQFGADGGYLSFSVAEFRPPEFLTTVSAAEKRYADSDLITATIEAKFLFGGGVGGAAVEWKVVADAGFFGIQRNPRLIFGDEFVGGRGAYQRVVAQGRGTLDPLGRLEIRFPADLGEHKITQQFTIEATVTDISNQSISGRTSVTVFPATVLIGLEPEGYVGTAGRPQRIESITTDWDGAPVPNQTVTVRVTEIAWRQNPSTLEWTQQRILVTEARLVTDAEGKATFEFTPERGGLFEISAETRDPRERIASSRFTVWVQGKDVIRWQPDDQRLQLIADRKDTYQPGETARILITSPFEEPVTALIAVERADILQHTTLTFEGSYAYELPIQVIHAPNVYISVVLLRPSGTAGELVPAVRYGLLNLSVAVQQQLKISATPSETLAEPNKTISFDFKVTDLRGQPVQAELGVALTDLATLSVGAPNSLPIFAAFWSSRGLSVITIAALNRLIDGIVPQGDLGAQAEMMMMRGGVGEPPAAAPPGAAEALPEGDAAKADAAQPDVRTNFIDTPLWLPSLITAPDGTARATLTLPDNLTTWRLDVRAISAQTFVGDATLDILSTKPLLVRPATPRFFVVGDEAELAVVVNNNTDRDLETTVRLIAEGVTLRAEPQQALTVPANGRVRVTWLAVVNDVTAVDLTFSAVSGPFGDASKPSVGIGDERLLPVYNYLAPDFNATAGMLRQPGSRTEGILVPSATLAPTGTLTVRLSPSLAAAALDTLRALENFPHDCLEQVVSRFLPNAVTYRTLQRLGLADEKLRADLEKALRQALDKLSREQKPDGGWGWYYNEEASTLVTAYALLGLIEAREADLNVPAEMINRAIAFLQARLPNISQQTPEWELNRSAFVLYVLARSGNLNVQALESLFTWREKLALYARGFLAQAYGLSRSAPGFQARIEALLSDIQSAAIVSATGIHWEERYRDWWNWSSDTRTTAILLQTLVTFTPESALIPNIIRWLMVARRADAWETTQESAWAVLALTSWMIASGELKADYTYTVSLNGEQRFEGVGKAETLKQTETLAIAVEALQRDQVNRLTFQRAAGEGAFYYTATLDVRQPVEAIQPTDRGIRLVRTYYDADGKPITEARVGDVITVALEITAAHDLYYIVINDPIPAGTEAIDRSLQTTAQIGQRPELMPDEAPYRFMWGWWYFSHTQLRTDRVVLSASYLPRGSYRYVYQIQATSAGTYRVIPPHGNEFYFPEVFGRGAGSLFTVRP
ncbi:MAG: Ig-like domain-containing protein [Aggregatilineales bacterium]